MTITPEQALDNLARLAEQALLNGPDRRTINESLQTLAAQAATLRALTAENETLKSVRPRPESAAPSS